MSKTSTRALLEALKVTYEVRGQELSDAALTVLSDDLSALPLDGVMRALSKCRKEVKGRLALTDILDRIPGGHPSPEEAWAIVARALTDEGVTLVWTAQISRAFGVALNLQGDQVAARMAFKETYAKYVNEAREVGEITPTWRPTFGHDPNGRSGPLIEALEKGRLGADEVARLLPPGEEISARVQAIAEKSLKQLEGKA